MGRPTKEGVMGDLHVTITRKLIKEIPKKKSDPRWTAMGIKMLSDNKVFMDRDVSNELNELDKNLQKKKKRDFGGTNITELATETAQAMGE